MIIDVMTTTTKKCDEHCTFSLTRSTRLKFRPEHTSINDKERNKQRISKNDNRGYIPLGTSARTSNDDHTREMGQTEGVRMDYSQMEPFCFIISETLRTNHVFLEEMQRKTPRCASFRRGCKQGCVCET